MIVRVGKLLAYFLLTVVALCAVAGVALYARLAQGPVALSFLAPTVQSKINANLSGMRVRIADVIIEREAASGRPNLRLKEITLTDRNGTVIARAPRATIGVDGSALFTGQVVPKRLELIGARILVQRRRDGSFQLGFADTDLADAGKAGVAQQPGSAGQPPIPPDAGARKAIAPAEQTSEVGADSMFDFLNQELVDAQSGAVARIDAVEVSKASITFYDEPSRSVWFSPQANLVFKRAPYGFALFADAQIASGSQPWRTEIAATYRANSESFNLSARIFDLVPAEIADDVFALSRLAQVKLPLSGHAEVEFTRKGVLTAATAELTAAAGRVGFPGYIAEPILIDEGLIRLDYDPATGGVVIDKSALVIEGVQNLVQGRVDPDRDEQGLLRGLKLRLAARGVHGPGGETLALDRVDLVGTASIEKARLDLDDLILMSGSSGLRMRGSFVGGKEAMGVFLSGRLRDVSERMLKALWPPIVTPKAREWIRTHVHGGRMTDGDFRIGIPAPILAASLRGIQMPEEVVDLKFNWADANLTYFDQLPQILGASGSARLRGDKFDLTMAQGRVDLPSGLRLDLGGADVAIREFGRPATPATFIVKATGPSQAFLELIDNEPLKLVTKAGFDPDRLQANTSVEVQLSMMLSKDPDPRTIRVTAKALLDDASIKAVVEGVDLTDGTIKVDVGEDGITASGPVKINGVQSKLQWSRAFDPKAPSGGHIVIESNLTDEQREKTGANLGKFLSGPIAVKFAADLNGQKFSKARIEADLSKATMSLEPIGWSRPAVPKTSAQLDLELGDKGQATIRNLKISGKNLDIRGMLRLRPDGQIDEATLPTVVLDEFNQFAVGMRRKADVITLNASGVSFDARPLISAMFTGGGHAAGVDDLPIIVDASVGRVYANRGEVITDLKGRINSVGGFVQSADLEGKFLNSTPVVLRITPNSEGTRNMRVVGRDGGAALRAANLYSKVAGGSLDFQAVLGSGQQATIQRGLLVMRNFEVRNEAALTEIDQKGKQQGPRRDALAFSKLTLPFSVDNSFVRIGDALVQGAEMGVSAQGSIRKQDGRMDIGGTIIPAYALNAALGELPILGEALMGGKGQGMFGLNFALQGTMNDPRFVVNPVSAIAPGFLRQLFNIGGGGVAADGTVEKPRDPASVPTRSNRR